MASVHEEIFSFVSKFTQLCTIGVDANLQLTNNDGKVSVVISADIGSIDASIDYRRRKKNIKPSQTRRRHDARSSSNLESHVHGDTVTQNGLNDIIRPKPCFIIPEPNTALPIEPPNQIVDVRVDVSTPFLSQDMKEDIVFGDDKAEIPTEVGCDNTLAQDITPLNVSAYPQDPEPKPQPSRPISQRDYFAYMEEFSISLGSILEKKLLNHPDEPT